MSHYYWPHTGGVERHIEELSIELIKRGHKITLITEQYLPDLPLNEKYKSINIVRIPYYAISSKRLVWTWIDEHNYLVEQADVVHIHDIYWWYWPTRLLQLIKPVYITFHGYEGNNIPRWQAVAHRKCIELVSRGSICIGDFMKKWYKAKPNFVSYGATRKSINKKYIKNDNNAVFWGRFDYDTGIDTYISGFSKLNNVNKLTIFGDGPLLEKVIESSSKDIRITNYGWEINLKKIITNQRYAFVSRYLSILEAMLRKKIVVAVYNNEIKKDYLECHPMRDNMIIAGSAEELAQKVNDLDNDLERRKRMTERAYLWAKEQTWEKMADLYEKLWKI